MILDFGCGNAKYPNSTGIDNDPNSDADVKHDLTKFPYPFKANTFDLVICNNITEHLPPLIRVLEEIWRICRDGAVIRINTPHCSSCTAWGDLTHVRAYNTKAWQKIEKGYYSAKFRFKVKRIRLIKTLPRRRKMIITNPRWFYILETYLIYLLGGFDKMEIELEVKKPKDN